MRRLNKKGLSQIVTTILLIMLILVAIGVVWFAVNNLIKKGINQVSTDSLTIDMEIVGAKINFTNGQAIIRVRRNPGEGTITGIKFLVEDSLGSDTFERKFTSFEPLDERTFYLNLSESEFLNLFDIYKISIASVYRGPDEISDLTGPIVDFVEGLNDAVNNQGNDTAPIGFCTNDLGCPADTPRLNSEYCDTVSDPNKVIQIVDTSICSLVKNQCISGDILFQIKTTCNIGEHCDQSLAACVPDVVACNTATDCGTNGIVAGVSSCSIINNELIVGDNKTYSCVTNVCQSITTEYTIENCSIANPGYQCFNAQCVAVPECTSDGDCLPQEFCNDVGVCELETLVNNGTITEVWPYYYTNLASPNFSDNMSLGFYLGYNIIFPQSAENRCIKIIDHVFPENGTSNNPYIRLDNSSGNIIPNIYYEIWKRDYICTNTSYYL